MANDRRLVLGGVPGKSLGVIRRVGISGALFLAVASMALGGPAAPHAVTKPGSVTVHTSGQPDASRAAVLAAGLVAEVSPMTSPPGSCLFDERGQKKQNNTGTWFICNCVVTLGVCQWIPLAEIAVGNLVLNRGNYIQGAKAQLIMQYDGNLVVYDESGHARWASNTAGKGFFAAFQTDGNLVVYDIYGRAVWASNTSGHSGSILAVQADGNVVIYPSAAWATHTNYLDAGNPQLFSNTGGGFYLFPGGWLGANDNNLVFQSDGNLVLYDQSGHARWASNTAGRGQYATYQTDGNLVVYGNNGAVWASGTSGVTPGCLAVQGDGNVVIYRRAIWATGTAH